MANPSYRATAETFNNGSTGGSITLPTHVAGDLIVLKVANSGAGITVDVAPGSGDDWTLQDTFSTPADLGTGASALTVRIYTKIAASGSETATLSLSSARAWIVEGASYANASYDSTTLGSSGTNPSSLPMTAPTPTLALGSYSNSFYQLPWCAITLGNFSTYPSGYTLLNEQSGVGPGGDEIGLALTQKLESSATAPGTFNAINEATYIVATTVVRSSDDDGGSTPLLTGKSLSVKSKIKLPIIVLPHNGTNSGHLSPACCCVDCQPPEVECTITGDPTVVEWTAARSAETWIIETCTDYSGTTQNRIDLTGTSGSIPYTPGCSYTIHGVNSCGEDEHVCGSNCPPACPDERTPIGVLYDVYGIRNTFVGGTRIRTAGGSLLFRSDFSYNAVKSLYEHSRFIPYDLESCCIGSGTAVEVGRISCSFEVQLYQVISFIRPDGTGFGGTLSPYTETITWDQVLYASAYPGATCDEIVIFLNCQVDNLSVGLFPSSGYRLGALAPSFGFWVVSQLSGGGEVEFIDFGGDGVGGSSQFLTINPLGGGGWASDAPYTGAFPLPTVSHAFNICSGSGISLRDLIWPKHPNAPSQPFHDPGYPYLDFTPVF